MNNDKTKELEELFKRWQMKHKNESDMDFEKTKGNTTNITKEHFCIDGIICEEKFEQENIKVLFISNEANDDEYSAKKEKITSRIESFNEFYEHKVDKWKGKLRERVCALYKVIIGDYKISENEVAQNFAFMNLNKRGGSNTIKDDKENNHIEIYVKLYKNEIKEEIEIIEPDIIVWLGESTYYLTEYLGSYNESGKVYINIKNKKVPILKMCHTSRAIYLSQKIESDPNFSNKILGKLATEMKKELNRYEIKIK